MKTPFIILVILLIVRLVAQIISATSYTANPTMLVISIIFAILYAACIFAVFKKMRWGAILVMVIAVFDLLAASSLGGAKGVGAAIFDLPLLALGYWAYKNTSFA